MSFSKQKILFFEEILADFFKKTGRKELPWRKKDISCYEVWVSEIMLQQTQVSRVVDFYSRFLERFPTVESLAVVSWEDFLPYYEGLGYYARGRNMLRAAHVVVTQYQGVFPKTKKELVALPGIGDYTANAILSFAYNQKTLAWDTNLKRVIGRFFFGSKNADIPEETFEGLFKTPRKSLNAALMDFGSLVCVGSPKCANCPLQKKCLYFQEGGKHEIKKSNKISLGESPSHQIVFLHEGHKKYFSLQKKKYQPFVLPAGVLSRDATKKWFLESHGLSVAVRPPHKKASIGGRITIFTNAQILAGKHQFYHFPKSALTGYTRGK